MRAHVIKDGVVVNTIKVESLDVFDNLVDASLGGEIGDTFDGSNFNTPSKPVEDLRDAIKQQRYEMETADIEYAGLLIKQDRESRNLLDMTCEKIRRGLVDSVDWHCKNGYLTLTADNTDTIELLCLQQIQTAFVWSKAELDKLEV